MNQNIAMDCKEIAQSIRGQKPPFLCPACFKEYKSVTGILYHLGQFGPPTNANVPRCVLGDDTPQGSPRPSPQHHSQNTPLPGSPCSSIRRRPRRELTWGEAQKLVEVELDNNYRRVEIDNDLSIGMHSEEEGNSPVEVGGVTSGRRSRGGGPSTPQKRGGRGGTKATSKGTPSRGKLTSASTAKNKGKRKSKLKSGKGEGHILLPKVDMNLVENFEFSDAPQRESLYFRFVEQSADELDDTIEYDMDEEDYQWLSLINEERKGQGLTAVPQDVFEILMDRLEKECIFESHNFGEGVDNSNKNMYNIDENAECCICNDGECHNTNAILFCDMCNLAVHQECYGVPYIPEGQWLCRRCIESPSRGVDCALCPNKGGAFKRTLDGRWAHVICAIWIPEVQFANPVFLEPIDGIKEIPAARWKLTCYVCRKRMGACIQCAKPNCYVAFHVTCAQQASLYMKLEVTKGGEIKKAAFCDTHTPPSIKRKLEKAAREREKASVKIEEIKVDGDIAGSSKGESGVEKEEEEGEENSKDGEEKTDGGAKEKESLEEDGDDLESGKQPRTVSSGVKKARQMMEEKKGCNVPVVSIPFVPQHRLDSIISRVSLHKKAQFIPKLVGYWKLKRQSRNGVPLLRRLQANKGQRASAANLTEEEREVLAEQLTLWKSLRHDLERARLLIELVRKREKLKREQLRLLENIGELQLRPLNLLMKRMLERISRKDPADIFADPVSVDEVPDYLDIIKKPMDFNTMKKKVEDNVYTCLDDFDRDFRLVWHNATIYNQKDTIYYRAAVRIKEAGQKIIQLAREQEISAGINSRTGLHDPPVPEPPPLTPSSIAKVPALDMLEVNDESMLDSFRERRPSTTSQVSLDEQIDFLQEKLQMIQSQSGYARKRKEKSLRRELTALRRQMRNERKISETDEQAPAGSPRRHRAPSIPRNAEELASHLLHGSLRMTPSRQQILSYSGIRLEERASALQKEAAAREAAAVKGPGGRNRLHSSSDSMLLKGVMAERVRSRQRVCSSEPAKSISSDGEKESGSEDGMTSSSSSGQSSEEEEGEEEEEDEEYVFKKELSRGNQSKASKRGSDGASTGPSKKKKKAATSLSRKHGRLKSRSNSGGSKSGSSSSGSKSKSSRGRESPEKNSRQHHGGVGEPDFNEEGLKKACSIKQKPLQRNEEGEDMSFDLSRSASKSRKPRKAGTSRSPRKMKPHPHSRRRLRSMDTMSSESDAEDSDVDVSATPSINGVRGANNTQYRNSDVTPLSSDPLPGGARRSPPSSQNRMTTPRNAWPLRRQSRSKSSSSIFETARESDVDEGALKSSCFSDSEIKGYLSTPGVPSASSNEDLTVSGARLKEGLGGGERWGRRHGKRKQSLSSGEESASGRKRRRLNSELSGSEGGGGALLNGMVMNGGDSDIKPMDLVWAKCRGYPPYPALVIDPSIPADGISVQGEKIKAPSDEVLQLQSKNPSATYLVRFFDGRRTWQWLPPEKVELLGVSSENDNLKISMAGSSKRSVKEAYTRAKQWLRRRARHSSKASEAVKEEEEEMSCDSNTNNDESTSDQFLDCT